MPSYTRRIDFAVVRCAFPGKDPSIQIEIPTASRFDSLETTAGWIKGSGNPMEVKAFLTVEILSKSLMGRSRALMEMLDDDSPDQLALATKDSVIGFMQRLCNLEVSIKDDETEKLEFFIFDVPAGTPGYDSGTYSTPGVYVEISHGESIADNVAWWEEAELPGTIFGYISIELPKESILPEINRLIDNKDKDPESLEEFVREGIREIFDSIIASNPPWKK